jgi:hypothetical protein
VDRAEESVKKLALVSSLSFLLVPAPALAQAPDASAPSSGTAPAPAPVPPPPAETAPPAPEPAEPEDAALEGEEESHWYDDLSAGIFVDTYYLANWNRPSDPAGYSFVGGNVAGDRIPHRAYDAANGFGLAFAGVDLAYEGEKVGGRISLREGGGAQALIGNPNPVMAALWQAYVTWSPTDDLAFDMGQFGTIYGAEVAESWLDLNYTRGALYYLMQPFYHTGIRATYQATETVGLKLMVVNGTNTSLGQLGFGDDDNQSPHVGAQVALTPSDEVALYVGYYTGAGSSGFGGGVPTSDKDWEHFVDVVFNGNFGDLTLVGNFDFYAHPSTDSIYWGISAQAAYSIVERFRIAARVEFLHNPDRFITPLYDWLTTATITLDYRPVENLVLRLDNRLEVASDPIYGAKDPADPRQTSFASILGVVTYFGI